MKDVDKTKEQFIDIVAATFGVCEDGAAANLGPGIEGILDALPFYVLLVDSDHHILLANEAVRRDLDLAPEQIVGGYCPKVVHGLDHPFPGCPLEEALPKGHAVERELFDPGSGHWLRSAVYPTGLRTPEGRAIFLHMVHDVTEHKQAEEEVQRNYQVQTVLNALLHISLIDISLEEQLQLILEHIISISWLALEKKGGIFLVEDDPQVLVMKVQHGLATPLLDMCQRVPFGRCLCGRAALSGEVQFADHVDDRHDNRYGGISPHGHYCVPILSAGKVLGVINLYLREGHRRDEREEGFLRAVADVLAGIIERKRAEEELRQLKEFNEGIVQSMLEGIAVEDVAGYFTFVNPAAATLLGYMPEELLGQHWAVIVPPDQHDIVRAADERRVRGEADHYEVELMHKEGTRLSALVSGNPRFEDGRFAGTLAVFADITERKRAEKELQQSLDKLRKTFEGTVNVLVSATGMRDRYTAGHQRQVTQLASAIANEMGLPPEQIEGIRMAGLTHDIGKIGVPVEILIKPVGLNGFEFGLIKAHPQVAYDILKAVEFPWPVAEIVLQHHERLDGSGYPQGLKGDEIRLEARILAVADVVEAMASHRPYRSALGLDRALAEISQDKGVLYDPEVVDACLKLFTEKGFKFE